MKKYVTLAAILGLFFVLCTSIMATPRPSSMDAERNRIICGNKYGSASSANTLFCMKYRMASAEGYVPAQPMLPCDACIVQCAATGSGSQDCALRCTRACGLN